MAAAVHRQLRAVLAVCLLPMLAPHGLAQYPESLPNAMFVPDNYVPLSEFRFGVTTSIQFTVRQEILNWAVQGNRIVYYAWKEGAVTETVQIPHSAFGSGVVNISNPPFDSIGHACVIVARALKNDLPIVTHWSNAINGEAGGFEFGASDVLPGQFPLQTPAEPCGVLYYGAAQTKNIFADSTSNNTGTLTPGHERYIGEVFCVQRLTDLNAIELSDRARVACGYPILHRNPETATQSTGSVAVAGTPSFQMLHALIVAPGAHFASGGHTAIPDDKNSLATFLVPPHWYHVSQNPAPTCTNPGSPIVMASFYDLHGGVANEEVGIRLIRSIAENIDDGSPIGVVWNGGGSFGCFGYHESFPYNAARAIQMAAELGGDPYQVIAFGGSRGGNQALKIGINELGAAVSGYRVRYVLSNGPLTKLGDLLTNFVDPTYPLVQQGVVDITGYSAAWRPDWTTATTTGPQCPAPPGGSLSGGELALLNIAGSSDPAVVDGSTAGARSPDSDYMIAKLQDAADPLLGDCQLKIVLKTGTHDHVKPFSHIAHYYDRLVAAGIPVQFEVLHHGGHGGPPDAGPSVSDLIGNVLTGAWPANNAFTAGIRHHTMCTATPLDYENTAPVGPLMAAPMVLEAPHAMLEGHDYTVCVVGPPGTAFVVEATLLPFNSVEFDWPGQFPNSSNQFFEIASGTLSNSNGMFGSAIVKAPSHTLGQHPLYFGAYRLRFGANAQALTESLGDQAGFSPSVTCVAAATYSSQSHNVSTHVWNWPLVAVLPESGFDKPILALGGHSDLSRTGGVSEITANESSSLCGSATFTCP